MTEEEKKIFWKLDSKLYLVNKNKDYQEIIKYYVNDINDKIVQEFINKLISWYYVKYSDKYIGLLNSKKSDNSLYYLNKEMSFEKLMLRIGDIIILDNNKKELFFKYLIKMAGWGLIYDKKTNPNYGLVRVKKMFDEFNLYYGWNLNTNEYDEKINYDYSLNNPDIVCLLKNKKDANEKIKNNNKLPKIRKLFRR